MVRLNDDEDLTRMLMQFQVSNMFMGPKSVGDQMADLIKEEIAKLAPGVLNAAKLKAWASYSKQVDMEFAIFEGDLITVLSESSCALAVGLMGLEDSEAIALAKAHGLPLASKEVSRQIVFAFQKACGEDELK